MAVTTPVRGGWSGAARYAGRLVAVVGRLRELSTLLVLALLFVLITTRTPYFLTSSNVEQILLSVSIIAICAIGQTLVVLTRNVDLSIEATVGLVAFLVGTLLHEQGLSIPVAVAIGCGIGLALGVVNGVLVAVARVPSIVATLGTLSIFRGLDFVIAGGKQVSAGDVPASFLSLAVSPVLGVPLMVLVAVVIALLVASLLRWSRPGRWVYAVGGNPDAATYVGIPSQRVVFGVFTLSGLLAGVAGVLWASRFGTINAHAAEGLTLAVVAAVVVGGVNIFGGSGTVLGAILGALLLGTIDNSLTLLHLSQFWLRAIDGAVILAAVSADALITRRLQRALALGRH
jgi:rhamnose transport system permease protein